MNREADGAPFLRHALLDAVGIEHGFGTRAAREPRDLVRPVQVHGARVARVVDGGTCEPREADAIVASDPRACVGIVTADCLPILVAAEDGSAVGAIHAGWRGLAAGVIAEGVAAVRALARAPLRAVIGPHIGVCCYEVDAPVLDALAARFARANVERACVATRAGHARIDLAQLAELDLERARVSSRARLALANGRACTRCEVEAFHSYRRDGGAAGRLVHFVRAGCSRPA